MATGGATGRRSSSVPAEGKEAEDFRHSCSLCLEPYSRRRVPKMLPCFHSFCQPCLSTLEVSVRSAVAKRPGPPPSSRRSCDGDSVQKEQPTRATTGEEAEREAPPGEQPQLQGAGDDVKGSGGDVTASQDDVGKASFQCPACRAPVEVPEGGVGKLQTNFYVDHDLSPEEEPSSAVCDACEGDSPQRATVACQDCRTSMCGACQRPHDKYTRNHRVTPLGLGQPAREKGEKRGRCLVHQDQVLCFHCGQCDVAVCLLCKVTSHEGHDTVDLVKAAMQAQEEIDSMIPTAQQQLHGMEAARQQVDVELRAMTRHTQDVTQQIQARRDSLLTWVRGCHDRLLDEVRRKEALGRGQLEGDKACMTLTLDTLTSRLNRAARATADDPQVVTCRKELKAALHSVDQHRADCQGRRSWRWTYEVSEDVVALQETHIAAFMGRVGEGGRGGPGEWREVESTVERLTKEVKVNAAALTSCTDHLARCQSEVTALLKKGEELEKKGDKLEKTTTSLQDEMAISRKTEAALQKTTTSLQDEMAISIETEAALQKTTTSLQDEMAISRKTEAALQKTTQSCMKKFGQAKELFDVNNLSKDTTQQHGAIIFQTALTNKGGWYDVARGVFTVPHNGVYFINAAVVGGADEAVCGRIKVDNETHCVFQSGPFGGSGSVLLPLTKGKTVWLEAVSPVHQYENIAGIVSYFRGVLVFPMP